MQEDKRQFSLTLLTLQAVENCIDAVLIGKLSKFDVGWEQKAAYSFYSGCLYVCV